MILSINLSFAQEDKKILKEGEGDVIWHMSSAKTIQEGRKESGIFAPLRIGLKNRTELSVHPLWFFVMPNAKVKKNWMTNEYKKLQVATEHGFTFPTILLNLLARSGTGGIFPSTKKAPPILTLKNKVIVSYFFHLDHSISLKAGMELNLLQSMYNDFPELELLIAYPRMANYSNFYTGELALSFSGVFEKRVGYDSDIRMFLIPTKDLTWVFEWNPKLYYHFSNKFRIMAGALLTTGNIQNEKAAFRAIPVLDLQFSFSRKNKKKK